MTEETYPGILERIKAIVTDGIVVIGLIFTITYFFALFETVSENSKIVAFIFIFFLYDPIFTSLFGGTIGHMLIGIRVKREANEKKNIIFPLAVIRYLGKAFLGWISLLTISSNKKRKAIHDYMAGSVVVYLNPYKAKME